MSSKLVGGSASAAATSSSKPDELSSEKFLSWLSQWKHASAQLEQVVAALRKRELVGAHPCAKATTECLRAMLGSCKFPTTDHMMKAVRAMGRELINASPAELCIGNIVIRVLYLIRDEYSQKLRAVEEGSALLPVAPSKRSHRSGSEGDMPHGGGRGARDRSQSAASSTASGPEAEDRDAGVVGDGVDIETAAGVNLLSRQMSESSQNGRDTPIKRNDTLASMSLADYADPSQQPSLGSVLGQHSSTEKLDFLLSFPDMRQSIIAAINELNDELDNVRSTVSESAQEHIHEDECILTFGYSEPVESFLKAACRKRKFQLIVAESEPSLAGHRLATELAKFPNISVTLIPDSGIFALMSRVNKVLISPSAVLVDGGAICVAGNLMVAIAAKEYSVPVVAIAGTYKLTPRFSHTQDRVLNNLLCPCDAIRYEERNIYFNNVDVIVPASEYVPPELINLFVTNNGSHQPSYVYRLMSEYYHPKDHSVLFD